MKMEEGNGFFLVEDNVLKQVVMIQNFRFTILKM